MSAGLVALFFSVGVGAWIYNQFLKRTNNKKSSVIGAVFVGVIAFIVAYTIFHSISG